MAHRIYLSPPDVGELEEEFVLDALRSGWVAPSGRTWRAFEGEMAERGSGVCRRPPVPGPQVSISRSWRWESAPVTRWSCRR